MATSKKTLGDKRSEGNKGKTGAPSKRTVGNSTAYAAPSKTKAGLTGKK